jgi:hypothetical protein
VNYWQGCWFLFTGAIAGPAATMGLLVCIEIIAVTKYQNLLAQLLVPRLSGLLVCIKIIAGIKLKSVLLYIYWVRYICYIVLLTESNCCHPGLLRGRLDVLALLLLNGN